MVAFHLEQNITLETLSDKLTLATVIAIVEDEFGIPLTPRSRYDYGYKGSQYSLRVFIPPGNQNDEQPEIVLDYRDANDNYTIDSAINHRELAALVTEARKWFGILYEE